jgi:hypothetical protein
VVHAKLEQECEQIAAHLRCQSAPAGLHLCHETSGRCGSVAGSVGTDGLPAVVMCAIGSVSRLQRNDFPRYGQHKACVWLTRR